MDDTRGGAWSEAAESYLDVLAVPLDPDGRRMTKVRAAELAGVSMSAVKRWRVAWPGFRAAEREAVAGRRQRNVEPLAWLFMNVLVTPAWRRLWRELNAEDGDVRLAWDVLQAAARTSQRIEVEQTVRLESLLRELRGMEDEDEADEVADLAAEAGTLPGDGL